MKGGKYIQRPSPTFRSQEYFVRDMRRSVLPKFIEILYGDAKLILLDEHQHGGRKTAKTSVTEFWYKSVN